jgi:hypothetical protein
LADARNITLGNLFRGTRWPRHLCLAQLANLFAGVDGIRHAGEDEPGATAFVRSADAHSSAICSVRRMTAALLAV